MVAVGRDQRVLARCEGVLIRRDRTRRGGGIAIVRRMPRLPLLVFVVGTGSLGAEIAAVRLLSPYFGASTIVWANTIGVVLVALSVGYWLGGRLADRHPDDARAVPAGARRGGAAGARAVRADPLLDVAVEALDDDLRGRVPRLAARGAGAGRGPGAAARRGVAVCASGWRSRASRRRARSPAACTRSRPAGSLVGTLLSALVLIPLVGTRRTFLIFALAIARRGGQRAAAGAPLRARARRDRGADRAAGRDAEGEHERRGPRDPRGARPRTSTCA